MALVCPADTITVDGTVAAAVLLLESVTIAPSKGAGALRTTEPVAATPPWTLAGLRAIEEIAIPGDPDVRVRIACCELLPTAAVTGAVVVAVTGLVVMANEAVLSPSGTPTVAGRPTALLGLESVMIAPPAGATLLSVSVP